MSRQDVLAGPPSFTPPFKVHLSWFAGPRVDPRCAGIGRDLYELLHRPLHDDVVQRPGIEIPVEFGRDLSGLLDALEGGREPAVAVRLVIAILDAAAFTSPSARDTVRRAMARWTAARTDEVFLPIIVGGAWHNELRPRAAGIPPITLERGVDDARRWRLGIEAGIAAGQILLRRLQDTSPPRPRVLLSYSRVDGVALTRTLAAHFREHARIETWFDTDGVTTGHSLERELQGVNGDAVVLVIRTDRYSESPECATELLAAKRSRAPIVTLLATVDGEALASAYSGNHRTMNWHAGREPEVAARCVLAWLHGHHFRACASAALALAGLPATSDVLPRRPELLDLVGLSGPGRRLVIHPDPPLTDGEATILRTAHPSVRIATPTTLLGRVLLAQDPEPPLTGTTLALSLSVAEDLPRLLDGRIGSGLTQDHLDDIVYSIVLATLRSGARIAYGGDFRKDGYTRNLVDLHRSYGGLGTHGSAQLICFLDGGAREGLDPESIEFDPVDVPAPPGADGFPALHALLWHLAMREVMADRCTGQVLLGGKQHPRATPDGPGYQGPWPGLLEEAWRTLRRDRALYIVGGFSGAAGLIASMLTRGEIPPLLRRAHHAGTPLAGLIEQVDAARRGLAAAGADADVLLQLSPGRFADLEDLAGMVLERWRRFVGGDREAWRNGLSVEENLRLLRSTDRTEITHLVFEGLRRIGRRPDGDLQLALYHGDIASVSSVDGYAVTVTPGVPRVGASAALERRMERSRTGSRDPAAPVALELIGTNDLPGTHVLMAQLELPPVGQAVAPAEVQRLAREVAQEANKFGLESIACPVFGATLGLSIADSARAMIRGFREGRGHLPAKLVFCETDRARYRQLRGALGARAVELRAGAAAPRRAGGPVLHVEVDEPTPAEPGSVRCTLYVAEDRQAVAPRQEAPLPWETWELLRRRVTRFDESVRVGRTMWRELLSPEIRDRLGQPGDHRLVVLGDEAASGLPWELLMEDRDGAPPLAGGIVRRIALRGPYRPPAEQVERSRLRALLVANPCGDLPSAGPETDEVERALSGRADVIVERMDGARATISAVTEALEQGIYDLFHYAGHAHLDEHEPEQSGLLLADGTLTAARLPAAALQLVFLSACESGRLRDVEPGGAAPRVRGNGRSLAEAFLRAGVRAFVGTFYAVDDADARRFASIVHARLAAGSPLGGAIRAARDALYEARSPDWGNFLLFGDDALVL